MQNNSLNNEKKELPNREYPPCVIVTEGVWIGSVFEILRSIGRHGVNTHVLVISDDKSYAWMYGTSRYCTSTYTIGINDNSRVIAEEILSWLDEMKFNSVPVLVPMQDLICSLLLEIRESLSGKFNICMARSDIVADMLNKPKANKIAVSCGLDVPAFGNADTIDKLLMLSDKLNCPVVLKPTSWREQGERFFKAILCNTKDEIVTKGSSLINNGATLLLQEYIPGDDGDVIVYMFYRNKEGSTVYGCVGRKIRQCPPGAGSMASGTTMNLPEVEDVCKQFLHEVDYRGIGGIEFKKHCDRYYFIEMSVRPEGFHGLAIQAGIDLPWLAYQDMVNNTEGPYVITPKKSYYARGYSYLSLLLKYRELSLVLKDSFYLFCKLGRIKFDVWDIRDPLPWFSQNFLLCKRAFDFVFRYFFKK